MRQLQTDIFECQRLESGQERQRLGCSFYIELLLEWLVVNLFPQTQRNCSSTGSSCRGVKCTCIAHQTEPAILLI